MVLISGGLLGGVGALYGVTVSAFAYGFFVTVGTVLSTIDLKYRVLPNRILLPATAVGVVLLLSAALADGGAEADGVAGLALRTVLGGAILFCVYLVLALISPRGMGMGDVKFAALVGMYLAFEGWRTLLIGAAAGFCLAALVAVVLLLFLRRRATKTSTIPFGPLMFLGALLTLGMTRLN